ncbi:MAG: type II toxin-antitoxin system VapC family toxin [Candidatus Brockarchaeota archaeon]|nr:type II toxin-antitoxin system VapC family toxin [Candidatus Brockarchaeota archaeon]MBO3808883.1 type II toxin-antitoxin system VapC family toxin [Candidatus Brockarchaeota archaeon]
MIVADSSAIIAFFLREEGWGELSKYMATTTSIDHAVKEFYNAVWKAVNIKRISVEDAPRVLALFKDYVKRNMELRREEEYTDKAFEIALENGITIYDALYITLALEERGSLLTLDDKQRHVSKRLGITTIP